jgi:DNA/RNA endonuclease YhcR with UshA esterase domain
MRIVKLLSLSLALAGLATAAFGQGMPGGGPYNPSTETTMRGTVDSVKEVPSQGRAAVGLHLVLNAASGPIEVEVGSASFVKSKNITFTKGDVLTVVGSNVTVTGQEVLIARAITKGDQVLTLRDEKGFPLWSGRGRGR